MTGERDLRLSITSQEHFLEEEQVQKMLEGQGALIQVWVARVMDTIDEEAEEVVEAPTREEEGEGSREFQQGFTQNLPVIYPVRDFFPHFKKKPKIRPFLAFYLLKTYPRCTRDLLLTEELI